MIGDVLKYADKYEMLPEGASVIACVSGGADSVCLLKILTEIAKDRGLTIVAAHFNHGLRGGESLRDEQFTREYAEGLGVECFIGRGDVAEYAKEHGMGIEEAAREMRYAFFSEVCGKAGGDKIATAHTADDNAETVIMRIARGSGLRGMCGIPPVRGNIIRPMLNITREQVLGFLRERNIEFVEDSTNELEIYTRNKVRHSVIPVLKEINGRFIESAASAASLFREDEDFLTCVANEFIDEHCTDGRAEAGALLALHPAISGRVIRSLFGEGLDRGHVRSVLELCRGGSTAAALSLPSCTVYRDRGWLSKDMGEPLDFEQFELEPGDSRIISEINMKVSCNFNVTNDIIYKSLSSFLFKTDAVCGKITVRPRNEGDKIKLIGRGCTKTLKRLFSEKMIPAKKRGLIPVIADEKGVLAVFGVGQDVRAEVSEGETAFEVSFEEVCG